MKAETNSGNGWYIAKHNGIMADQVHNFQNGTDEYGTTFEQWEGAGYTLTPVTVTPNSGVVSSYGVVDTPRSKIEADYTLTPLVAMTPERVEALQFARDALWSTGEDSYIANADVLADILAEAQGAQEATDAETNPT